MVGISLPVWADNGIFLRCSEALMDKVQAYLPIDFMPIIVSDYNSIYIYGLDL